MQSRRCNARRRPPEPTTYLFGRTGSMSTIPGRVGEGLRHREIVAQQLRDMIGGRVTGSPTLAAIYGDIGHGKSTMLAELVDSATRDGHRVVSMHGEIPYRDIPYAGLHWLISRNINLLDGCNSPSTRLLRRVLVDFTPPDSVLSMCSSVAAWFDCLAPDAPLLVAVDDADQLDEQSLRVLAYVSSQQQPGRSAVVLTSTKPIPLFERLETQRFELDDLEPPEALRVVGSVGASRDTASRLVDRLGGNPLALIRVGSRVVNGEVALRDDEPLPIPGRLEEDVQQRAEALSAPARQLLEAAAVSRRIDVASLSTWSQSVNRGPVTDLLADAEDAGIIDFDGKSMSWRRRWMAEAVLRRCSDCRRHRLREEFRALTMPHASLPTPNMEALTPGERRVMEVIIEGASTREAARFLKISEKTVESHVQSIYRKLDVRSRAQLGAVAHRANKRDFSKR
jgi:DNA-binding CsgD family transcriptional regulator